MPQPDTIGGHGFPIGPFDESHPRAIDPLVFGLLDDGGFDHLLRRIKIDGCLVSRSFATSDGRAVCIRVSEADMVSKPSKAGGDDLRF